MRPRPRIPGRRWAAGVALSLVSALTTGCELEEVTLAQPVDVLVAEAYVLVGDGVDQATAFLHWTEGTRPARDLLGTAVTLAVADTLLIPLTPGDPGDCLLPGSVDRVEGACFDAGSDIEDVVRPGDRVKIEIVLPEGRELEGATVVPESFTLIQPRASPACALPPGRILEFLWDRSEGTWAYSAEAAMWGLRDAFATRGISVEADSITLIGLAVSEADTSIAFPSEFGVFNRFDLQQEVAVALQEGLPAGVVSDVVIAALDRNYVNWVRGGNFNPSGPVRVPSLRGEGTGVLGSAVRRTVRVVGALPGSFLPSCFQGR